MLYILVPILLWTVLAFCALFKVNAIVKKYKNMRQVEYPKEWAGLVRGDFNNWNIRSMRIGCFLRFPFHFFLLIVVNLTLMSMVLLIKKWQTFGKIIQKPTIKFVNLLLRGIFSIDEKFQRKPIDTPIVSANHVNWFDMFYLGALCYPIGFVAKQELQKTPFIGKIGTFIQCIFVNRKDTSAREETIQLIKKRIKDHQNRPDKVNPLLIFPEGTTSNGKGILRFKMGAFNDLAPITLFGLNYECDGLDMGMQEIIQGEHIVLSLCLSPKLTVHRAFVHAEPNESPVKYMERVRIRLAKLTNCSISDCGFTEKCELKSLRWPQTASSAQKCKLRDEVLVLDVDIVIGNMSMKKISGYVIKLKEVLGKGSYGSVYLGEHQQTHRECAIKVIDKKQIFSDEYLKAALLQQIQILQQVRSRNIVGVFEVMESSNNYYIIQELCDSDLEKYIRDHPDISEVTAIDFLKQIVNGFISLVREGIIHRDIKPANLLLAKGEIKIGDFGFAKRNVSKKMKIASSVGTPLYMSVEVLKAVAYTSKCDVWGVGFIFYQMLHHRTPWSANSVYELVNNIESKPLKIAEHFSPSTKDFIRRTLAIKEKDRASWDDVFDHPIFEGYFEQYKKANKKIEDKLKAVMGELRFRINSQNIDVRKLLGLMGIKSDKIELDFGKFSKFLQYISPTISEEEVRYFFDRVDEDSSGTISVEEIEKQMSRHLITLDRSRLRKAETYSEQQQPKGLSEIQAQKAKKCFERLCRVLTYKKISLRKTFQAYDKEGKGNLSFDSFRHMLSRLDNSISEEDAKAVFDLIDADSSNSIEFDELNAYYCKVNSLPQTLE